LLEIITKSTIQTNTGQLSTSVPPTVTALDLYRLTYPHNFRRDANPCA